MHYTSRLLGFAPLAYYAFCVAVVEGTGSAVLRPHYGSLVRRDGPIETQNQASTAAVFMKDMFGSALKGKQTRLLKAVNVEEGSGQDGKDPLIVKTNPFDVMPEVEDAPTGADTPLDPPQTGEEEAFPAPGMDAPMFLQMAEDTHMESKAPHAFRDEQLRVNVADNETGPRYPQTGPTVSITVEAPEAEVKWKDQARAAAEAARLGDTSVKGELHEDDAWWVEDKFAIGTQLCEGATVGVEDEEQECQFRDFRKAEEFCDSAPSCSAVIQRYGSNHCAGGYGCFSPRRGKPVKLRHMWGGKTWLKSAR